MTFSGQAADKKLQLLGKQLKKVAVVGQAADRKLLTSQYTYITKART